MMRASLAAWEGSLLSEVRKILNSAFQKMDLFSAILNLFRRKNESENDFAKRWNFSAFRLLFEVTSIWNSACDEFAM